MTLEYFKNTNQLNNAVSVYSFLDCVIVKEDDLYFGLCLNLDVASQGETVEETKENLKEAIELYLEDAMDDPATEIFRLVPDESNPIFTQKKDIAEIYKLYVNEDLILSDYGKVA